MAIYKTASYRVQPQSLPKLKQAIDAYITYIRSNEPNTILYTSLQSAEDETAFLHVMGFTDAAAEEKHRTSDGTRRFVNILYPETIDSVKFSDYHVQATTLS